MKRTSTSVGLLVALVAALSFGTSGAFGKSLLDAGWSPIAAVTFRALIGGLVLAPFAIRALRGRWIALWHARTRVLLMALVGVSATQLLYFSAIKLIPVSDAVLIEYLAPLLMVGWVWARSRRVPKFVVLAGSVVALIGLVLVVSPEAGTHLPILGLLLACGGAVGCAIYFTIAAAPSAGLPPVALASVGLIIGAAALAIVGATRILPFTVKLTDVHLFGGEAPWWVPLAIIGIVATAIAYATSITASEILGSRLSSFMGLLEVVAAAFYAWILLGQALRWPQLVGGALILAGIALVRAEKSEGNLVDAPLEAAAVVRDLAPSPSARREPVSTATSPIDL
jgi:drug/metabolite transporter (DMT)-like permease